MSPQIKMIVVNKSKFPIAFALLCYPLLFGCLKPEEFPNEPRITFKSIEFDEFNNAILRIDFTDGNGNFGLDEGDFEGRPDSCVTGYNLFIRQFELQNGNWADVTSDPCLDPENIALFYRVPWAKPSGQIKTQKGEIKVDLDQGWYLESDFDTVRFEITIMDRDFNKSNVLTTDYYLKP